MSDSDNDDCQSQVSDMDHGQTPPAHLEHLKISYDQTFDYQAIAEDLFDGEKVLVVQEKIGTNHHVHMQGYTTMAARTFSNKMTKLAQKHYLHAHNKRPVKRAGKGIDEKGFQYAMKEGNVIWSRGFSEADLAALKLASDEFVRNLKESLRDWIQGQVLTAADFQDPAALFNGMILKADKEYLRPLSKDPSRHTRIDVAKGIRNHPLCTDEVLLWLHAQNKF